MGDGVRFSRRAAGRIAEATRRVEGMPPQVRPAAGMGMAREPRGGQAWLFVVKVAKDGGSDGSNAVEASWTYTVSTVTGEVMQTGVAMAVPRIVMAKVTAGSGYGLAFYDEDGNLKLLDAGERYGQSNCS
ncbi:MAG: hypothetical protein IT447_08740 [Phycisphaerales bacterium]|nr:hypothetical protein [Phycisphaerales bacterium]